MTKPTSPAHSWNVGLAVGLVYDSMAERSSRNHVFPIENVPFGFSFDLCMRTRPDFRTATMMIRGFSAWAFRAWGGGGAVGYDEYSTILMCVIYVSSTAVRAKKRSRC